jgi:hypothetical protein
MNIASELPVGPIKNLVDTCARYVFDTLKTPERANPNRLSALSALEERHTRPLGKPKPLP